MLVNPNNPNAVSDTKNGEASARALRLRTHVVTARTERDFDAAFASLVEQRVGALFVAPDQLIGLVAATHCPRSMIGASWFPRAV